MEFMHSRIAGLVTVNLTIVSEELFHHELLEVLPAPMFLDVFLGNYVDLWNPRPSISCAGLSKS